MSATGAPAPYRLANDLQGQATLLYSPYDRGWVWWVNGSVIVHKLPNVLTASCSDQILKRHVQRAGFLGPVSVIRSKG